MVLRDKMQINRPPEIVWHFIADQDLLQLWNARIKAIVPVSQGRLVEGFRCRMRYDMQGKESNFLAEIMEYSEPLKLVIHLTGGNLPLGGYAQEVYELSKSGEGTVLRQNIGIHNSGINALLRCFMVSRHRFFRPAREKYVKRLKELVEKSKEES